MQTIKIIVPKITDQTYNLLLPENIDKDVVVALTDTEEITSAVLDDGSIVKGTMTKETTTKTTLGEIKEKIKTLENWIEIEEKNIIEYQDELNELAITLSEVESKVAEALEGWKPESAEEVIDQMGGVVGKY
jgi:flagellar motility protein MotE (MotC chaperone)